LRIRRLHIHQALEPGLEVALEETAAHYLARVLRVGAGQAVVLFNGDGFDYAGEVLHVGRRETTVAVSARLPGLAESALKISVVQAVSRGERMDHTLQKCTELGAAEFQPLFSERSEVRLEGAKLQRRLDHWRGVVISACEQSGRARIPPVHAPLSVQGWLDRAARGSRLVLDPEAESPLAAADPLESVELAVGPEGGFSEPELVLMGRQQVQAVSLGPRTLRTETAAPAAVAVLQCLKGDLGCRDFPIQRL
jgi:16S rRNA (uracil1498-N3)-methyltransferase